MNELDLTCVACGFNSDDAHEFTAHCRGHEHLSRWDRYRFGLEGQHAYDIWLEGNAA